MRAADLQHVGLLYIVGLAGTHTPMRTGADLQLGHDSCDDIMHSVLYIIQNKQQNRRTQVCVRSLKLFSTNTSWMYAIIVGHSIVILKFTLQAMLPSQEQHDNLDTNTNLCIKFMTWHLEIGILNK